MSIYDIQVGIRAELKASSEYEECVVRRVEHEGAVHKDFLSREEGDGRLDGSLESSSAWWPGPPKGAADVLSVIPEEEQLNLRFATAAPPGQGQRIRVYPPMYLARLLELWERPEYGERCSAWWSGHHAANGQDHQLKMNSQPFPWLRMSVIRFAATGGFERKLTVAFTYFDQVQGINLPRYQDKRNHVLASLKNGIASLRAAAGSAVSSLETRIYGRCYMLGAIDRPSDQLPNGPRQELDRLLDLFEASLAPVTQAKMGAIYDTAGLVFAVQTAADDFHRLWNARLGFTWQNGIDKEHWTRVKALARRLALQMDNLEYDNLRPVADLLLRLQEAISRFLDNPMTWGSKPQTKEEEVEAINAIRQEVSTAHHNLVRVRLADGQLQNWLAAFDESGRGAASRRALRRMGIYEGAAPVPGVIITETASQFLDDVRGMVHSAIEATDGELRSAPVKRPS